MFSKIFLVNIMDQTIDEELGKIKNIENNETQIDGLNFARGDCKLEVSMT